MPGRIEATVNRMNLAWRPVKVNGDHFYPRCDHLNLISRTVESDPRWGWNTRATEGPWSCDGSVQVGACKPVIDPMGVVRAATVTLEIAHDTMDIIIKNIK